LDRTPGRGCEQDCTVERPAKHRGSHGHQVLGIVQEPQALGEPALDDALSQAISEAACYRAEARGFEPRHATEDWIEAEQQVVGTHHPAANAAKA
jgi:hypothetical protein